MTPRRMLAPVGYRVPLSTVIGAAMRAAGGHGDGGEAFLASIERHFSVRAAFGVSSGKAALTILLSALARLSGRTRVIVPAYTCYSVPSAVVKAGLDVVPCDIASDSFDYDYGQLLPMLRSDVLCVLSVHLFGVPSDTARLIAACRSAGIYVVEDAAQAMGGTHNGRHLGTAGDAGIFSLGRGKNVTCGSGGVIVTRDGAIAEAIRSASASIPPARPLDGVAVVGTLLSLSALLSPWLYWFPAGLPFLRLGETIFHDDFPMNRLSSLQALLLRDWPSQLAELDAVRRRNAGYYIAHVAAARDAASSVAYLRFPVRLPAGTDRGRLLGEQGGAVLGMSAMYPTSVGAIPQLRDRLEETRFPQADEVARSLVTLPTHPLVSDDDRTRICAAVNAATNRASRSRVAALSGAVA